MPDEADKEGQRAILEKVVGNRFSLREFGAKQTTAPHVYAIRKIAVADSDASRAIGVDISFIVYGSLETVSNRDFLEGLSKKSKDRQIHVLSESELDKRKLTAEPSKQRDERYSHGLFIVLERVELHAALHTIITRHPDSLVATSRVDPRFAKDTDFPNQWRKITVDEEGQRGLGPTHPYSGAGGFLKITRLHEPKGALFVEYHLIYNEPKGWFSGADPLTTKLPAIIQSEVRTFRRELSNFK